MSPDHPRYQAIANAIAAGISEGTLAPGDRLPTHRDLADTLGVTVGTVSRGYREAERRGLIAGEVGRGTFVRGPSVDDPWPVPTAEAGAIDLSLSLPTHLPEEGPLLADSLRRIAGNPRVGDLLTYRAQSGDARQMARASDWLARVGIQTRPAELLFTAGSQHGLNVVFNAMFPTDAVVLASELTYPSVKAIARSAGVRLRGVELDDEGMCPAAVVRACQRDPRPAGVYVVPTLQNPTSATMSIERRQQLAKIAEAHDLWIVEDDIHALLPPKPITPIAAFAPARTVYLSSVAKCLVPGLRTGLISAPVALRPRLLSAIHSSMWMPAPLMLELTCEWFSDGTADRLLVAKRHETARRQQIAQRVFQGCDIQTDPHGYQLWWTLPEPWHADEFVSSARERGVIIVGAGAFAIGRNNTPAAVRISIGGSSPATLEKGLTILRDLAHEGSAPSY